MPDTDQAHPGSGAGPDDVLRFADAYRDAAMTVLGAARGGAAAERAPGRFCAIHAIELYLDAFLRRLDVSPCQLRAQGHDLSRRAAMAISRGLTLRRKTALHLVQLTREREYLVQRYGPERAAAVSELNRLTATLDEVARRVRAAFHDEAPTQRTAAA